MNNHVANPFEKILGIWMEPQDNSELPVEEKKSIEPEVEDILAEHQPCSKCEG